MSRCQRECHRFEPDILLQVKDAYSNVIYDMLVRFQLHASCVDRSMVEQRLKQPSHKGILFISVGL